MNLFSTDSSTSFVTRIIQGVLSVLGVYAIIRFLPRIVSSVFKRFVIVIVGEILLVAGGTLLTEQWSRRSGTTADTVRSGDASSRPDTR